MPTITLSSEELERLCYLIKERISDNEETLMTSAFAKEVGFDKAIVKDKALLKKLEEAENA